MAIFDGDLTLEAVRVFRDREGKATGLYVTGEAKPTAVEGGADEPAFSGESYLKVELFLDNAREADNLKQGDKVHVTFDVAPQGG